MVDDYAGPFLILCINNFNFFSTFGTSRKTNKCTATKKKMRTFFEPLIRVSPTAFIAQIIF